MFSLHIITQNYEKYVYILIKRNVAILIECYRNEHFKTYLVSTKKFFNHFTTNL